MNTIIFHILLCSIVESTSRTISYIQNVTLKPLNDNNLNTIHHVNGTCQQCLCDFFSSVNNVSYLALNCFPNNTCEFYTVYPQTYKLLSAPGTQLYFLQNIHPNTSSCCMPDITELINRLKNATPTMVNLTFEPAALAYDEMNPNEVAMIGRHSVWIYWFNAFTLTLLRNISIINSSTQPGCTEQFDVHSKRRCIDYQCVSQSER